MSFIPTSTARVQAFAGALYGVQAGSTTMAAVNRDIANNGEAATFNTYFSLSFGSLSSTQVAERLVTNLGITEAGFVAVNYIVGQLNGTPKAATCSISLYALPKPSTSANTPKPKALGCSAKTVF